jgi:hypothetical protein
MSNERRHELEKNDLAILLDRVSKAIEPYSMMIALGLGALFIGGIGWLLYNSEQSGDRSVATLELIQGAASQDSELLLDVSEDYPGTAAASWAKVYQGQLQLSQGIQTLYRDQEEAKQLLSDSKLAFESAIKDDTDQLLRSRSYLGIARADESLGDFEGATKAYEQVVSIAESEAMIKQAEQRIAALGDPKTKDRSELVRNTGIGFTIAGVVLGVGGVAMIGSEDIAIWGATVLAPVGGTLIITGVPLWVIGASEIPELTEPESEAAIIGGTILAGLGVGGTGVSGVVAIAGSKAALLPLGLGLAAVGGGIVLATYGAEERVIGQASMGPQIRLGPGSFDLRWSF